MSRTVLAACALRDSGMHQGTAAPSAGVNTFLRLPKEAFEKFENGGGAAMNHDNSLLQQLFLRLGSTPATRTARAETLFRRLRGAENRDGGALSATPPMPLTAKDKARAPSGQPRRV